MRLQLPRGNSLPRAQAAATGVIAGVLALIVDQVAFSGMALLPSAILTLVVAVVILLSVATVMTTFSEPVARFTDRVLGDEDPDPGDRDGD